MLTTLLACSDHVAEETGIVLAGAPWDRFIDSPAPVFIIGGGIAVIAILSGTITSIVKTRAREQTRRELAAYVAEGSLDADKAVEMLRAEPHD